MPIKIGSELFTKELNLIKDSMFKNIIIDILDNHIHYDNFLNPSSSTGKYHPPRDSERYGNTNHTKAVVKLCNVMLSSRLDLNGYYSDVIYAAAILHDMWKYSGTKHSHRNHAELAYNYLYSYKAKNNMAEDSYIGKKINLMNEIIKFHMGHWSLSDIDNWINEINEYCGDDKYERDSILLLHYADLIASRKFYDVDDFAL